MHFCVFMCESPAAVEHLLIRSTPTVRILCGCSWKQRNPFTSINKSCSLHKRSNILSGVTPGLRSVTYNTGSQTTNLIFICSPHKNCRIPLHKAHEWQVYFVNNNNGMDCSCGAILPFFGASKLPLFHYPNIFFHFCSTEEKESCLECYEGE